LPVVGELMANILVGASSWTDKSLVDPGRFCPVGAKTPEDRLRYYSLEDVRHRIV
jgi:hypothetical protein